MGLHKWFLLHLAAFSLVSLDLERGRRPYKTGVPCSKCPTGTSCDTNFYLCCELSPGSSKLFNVACKPGKTYHMSNVVGGIDLKGNYSDDLDKFYQAPPFFMYNIEKLVGMGLL